MMMRLAYVRILGEFPLLRPLRHQNHRLRILPLGLLENIPLLTIFGQRRRQMNMLAVRRQPVVKIILPHTSIICRCAHVLQ